MWKIAGILFLSLLSVSVLASDETSGCMTCHADFEEDDGPSHLITRDVHFQKGLGCTDCHGGDPALDDMDEVRQSRGWRGVPSHREVPEFCARCHADAAYMHEHNPALATDQLSKYRTSVHGQKLFYQRDDKVANCVSCHSVHEIANARLPHSSTHPANIPATCGKCHSDADYMAGYDIPTDQLEEFTQSVHGQALLERGDLGAPACNDCHGNHGAAPPGVASLAAVCGVCHALEAELFVNSPHRDAYEENDFPMCETCHSNHKIVKPSDLLIGSSEESLCSECHSPDDGTIGSATADSINATILGLVAISARADSALSEAMDRGMMTIDEEFLMKEIAQTLIQTRTLVHSFNVDSVTPKASEGAMKADTVIVKSAALVEEYYFRRKGLVVASLFITFLAAMLYRRIRQMGD